ncbi:MAG: nuclear transport factor 2 family protein [Sneathiella sp.]
MNNSKSKKKLLQKLLKGIETGDPEAATVVNEQKYIQHNPQTHEGSEGLGALFSRLSKTSPKVRFVRVFEDGNFAFAHNEYDFNNLKAAFEIFRFEDGQAVEHWDNIQPKFGPNQSGRDMLDGPTEITDLDRTEDNRERVRCYVNEVLIKRSFSQICDFVEENFHQHNPDLADGTVPLLSQLKATTDGKPDLQYETLHHLLAEGNFVLSLSEGRRNDIPTSFCDLYRLKDGKIVEHWDTIETIAPRTEWKNANGKF